MGYFGQHWAARWRRHQLRAAPAHQRCGPAAGASVRSGARSLRSARGEANKAEIRGQGGTAEWASLEGPFKGCEKGDYVCSDDTHIVKWWWWWW